MSRKVVTGVSAIGLVIGLLGWQIFSSSGAWAAGEKFRDCANCPEMVVLPPGTYEMGAVAGDRWAERQEQPRRTVQIKSPFAIGVHHVTVGQFREFVRSTNRDMGNSCIAFLPRAGWQRRTDVNWEQPHTQVPDNHPVVCVNWEDATAYAEWLSKKTGRLYRLPTEAEWEYAARGGRKDDIWIWGNDPQQVCNHANGFDESVLEIAPGLGRTNPLNPCNDRAIFTSPVGSYKPNGFGLYDMAGNAWHWIADCWGPLDQAPVDGSRAADSPSCDARVNRGGGWSTRLAELRISFREYNRPGDRGNVHGFRLVAPTR